jgi:hypothetical protein
MQSKSLVDLIQLECLSQSSAVLHITQGGVSGWIWVQNGEIIDATAGTFTGEDAFKEILSWKSGNFEIMPPEPERARTINKSYQGLLLDSAQALDESRGQAEGAAVETPVPAERDAAVSVSSGLAPLARFEGVEFLLTTPLDEKAQGDSWGLENAQEVGVWARATEKRLRELADKIGGGALSQVTALGPNRNWALSGDEQKGILCVGFRRTLAREKVEQTMKHIFTKWLS